LFASFS